MRIGWAAGLLLPVLAWGETAEPAPLSSRTSETFRKALEESRSLTAAELRDRRLPPGRYLEALPFDPEKAAWFAEIRRAFEPDAASLEIYRKRGLVVCDLLRFKSFGDAYHGILRRNLPVFITSDSILQTIYKSYDDLLVDLEEEILLPSFETILARTHEALPASCAALPAHPAHARAADELDLWLTASRSLLAGEEVPSRRGQEVGARAFLAAIDAGGMPEARLFGRQCAFDASQFKPRGHYTRSSRLKRYFRGMMWLGRVGVPLEKEEQWRTVLLLQDCLRRAGVEEDLDRAKGIVDFLVGQGDDPGPGEIRAVLKECGASTFAEKAAVWPKARGRLSALRGAIRSAPLPSDPQDRVVQPPPLEYRLFGQRFTIDAFVLEQVTFDRVLAGEKKVRRYLPNGLDVAFALGNDAALRGLAGELSRYSYAPYLEASRRMVEGMEGADWDGDLYGIWISALRALNRPAGANVPSVMRTEAWDVKTLQAQLASYAQLKHNTVLYTKQGYGGGPACEYPAGFVEPVPRFYERLAFYARRGGVFAAAVPESKSGIRERAVGYFENLEKTMGRLQALAEKELQAKPFDKADLKFIKEAMEISHPDSGPTEYHGWYPGLFYGGSELSVEWDPIATDVFTDPGGEDHPPHVLQMGTGDVYLMLVAIDSGPDRMAFVGPVSSYYEWAPEGLDRITDEEWKERLRKRGPPDRPAWVRPIVGVQEATFAENPRLTAPLVAYKEAVADPARSANAFRILWGDTEGKGADRRLLAAIEEEARRRGLPATLSQWAELMRAKPAKDGEEEENEGRITAWNERPVKEAAFSQLSKGLKDPMLRARALEGFREGIPPFLDEDAVLRRIAPSLREPDAEVRRAAVEAIAGFPDPGVPKRLREALGDPAGEVRGAAAWALLARNDAEAYPEILRMAEAQRFPDSGFLLRELRERGVATGGIDDAPPRDPLQALDPSSAGFLGRSLAVPDLEVQKGALQSVGGKPGPEDIEALLAYLDRCDRTCFEGALALLRRAEDPGLWPRALEAAGKRGWIRDPTFLRFAAEKGDARALPFLKEAAEQSEWLPSDLFAGWARLDKESAVRFLQGIPPGSPRVGGALEAISRHPEPAWAGPLVGFLRHPKLKEEEFSKALWMLRECTGLRSVGPRGEDWIAWWERSREVPPAQWKEREAERLSAGLRQEDSAGRLAALRALGEADLARPAPLRPLLSDPDWEVQKTALWMLVQRGEEEDLQACVRWISEGAEREVKHAIQALRASGAVPLERRTALLLPLLSVEDPARRGWIFSSLESFGYNNPPFRKAMGEALSDPIPEVRAGAVRALEWSDLETVWGSVVALLADPDARVRHATLRTLSRKHDLSKHGKEPELIRLLLERIGDADPDAAKMAIWVASNAKLEGAARRILAQIGRKEVCPDACRALGQLQAPEAVSPLEKAGETGDEKAREAAAWALSLIRTPESFRALLRLQRKGIEVREMGSSMSSLLGRVVEGLKPEEIRALAREGVEARRALWYPLSQNPSEETFGWLLDDLAAAPPAEANGHPLGTLERHLSLPGAPRRLIDFAKKQDDRIKALLFPLIARTSEPGRVDLALAWIRTSQSPGTYVEWLKEQADPKVQAFWREQMRSPKPIVGECLLWYFCEHPVAEDEPLLREIVAKPLKYENDDRKDAWRALAQLGDPIAVNETLKLALAGKYFGPIEFYFEDVPSDPLIRGLVLALSEKDPAVSGTALGILRKYTNQGLGPDAAAWIAWWEKSAKDFRPDPDWHWR